MYFKLIYSNLVDHSFKKLHLGCRNTQWTLWLDGQRM
jgi:hypothetical protein